jgi:hypothetical protein
MYTAQAFWPEHMEMRNLLESPVLKAITKKIIVKKSCKELTCVCICFPLNYYICIKKLA